MVCALRRGAAACKSITGEGVDGFHLRLPLDLSDVCCDGILTLLRKVEMARVWSTDASTALFFLIFGITTSGILIPLLPTLIRWWECQELLLSWNGRDSTSSRGTLVPSMWEVRKDQDGRRYVVRNGNTGS